VGVGCRCGLQVVGWDDGGQGSAHECVLVRQVAATGTGASTNSESLQQPWAVAQRPNAWEHRALPKRSSGKHQLVDMGSGHHLHARSLAYTA
jgi:hypothetical protein